MPFLEATALDPDYDVIVVGSGAAGGQTAYTLCMEGARVLMLEAGRRYQPETLVGVQVLRPDGAPYDDDAASPDVLLGDSFTGVYQLTDCEHAGLSAHLARALGHPVDLVMSYGGGPNVRHKLMRRGAADLGNKRLVIWVMTARDLYNYWEDWEPLGPTELGTRQAKR